MLLKKKKLSKSYINICRSSFEFNLGYFGFSLDESGKILINLLGIQSIAFILRIKKLINSIFVVKRKYTGN